MRVTAIVLSALICSNAQAAIDVAGPDAEEIYKSVEIIGRVEGVELIFQASGGGRAFALDQISCVFEMYNACSFFAKVKGERRLIVATEGAAKFMRALADSGVPVDQDSARMDVDVVRCEKAGESDGAVCHIE